MCAPAQMDSTQSRLHWNRLRRSFREWKAATVGPAHWRRLPARQALRSGQRHPASGAECKFGSCSSHASSTEAVAAVMSFSSTTPLAPGSLPPCPASMATRYGGSPTCGRNASPDAETLPCSCEETRNASRQRNAEKTNASTQKQSVRAVRRKELSFRFALRFFFWCVGLRRSAMICTSCPDKLPIIIRVYSAFFCSASKKPAHKQWAGFEMTPYFSSTTVTPLSPSP